MLRVRWRHHHVLSSESCGFTENVLDHLFFFFFNILYAKLHKPPPGSEDTCKVLLSYQALSLRQTLDEAQECWSY